MEKYKFIKLLEREYERLGNYDALAKKMGDVTTEGIRRWIKMENFPRAENIERFADAFGYDSNELTRDMIRAKEKRKEDGYIDKLKILLAKKQKTLQIVNENVSNLTPLDGRQLATIPVIGNVNAGEGIEFTDQGYPVGGGDEFMEIPATQVKSEYDYALTVKGDSMEWSHPNGTLIHVTPTQEARQGNLVVVRFANGDVVFKRLKLKRDDLIILESQNQKYDDIVCKPEDLHFIHKVKLAVYPK